MQGIQALEQQIRSLEYENVVRSRAVEGAQILMRQVEEDASAAASTSAATLPSPSLEQVRERCSLWAYEHSVIPGLGWGTLPEPLRRDWMTLRCHEHLPPPAPAKPTPPASFLNAVPAPPPRRPPAPTVPQKPEPRPLIVPSPASGTPPLSGAQAAFSSLSSWATSLSTASTSAQPVPEYRGYTFWSSDFHISPIADLKDLFQPLGMKIIDKSLSGHCHLKNTCAKNIKVLNKGNGISLGKCPNQLRRDFFAAYKQDPLMVRLHYTPAMCFRAMHPSPYHGGSFSERQGRMSVPGLPGWPSADPAAPLASLGGRRCHALQPRLWPLRSVHGLQQVAYRSRFHSLRDWPPRPEALAALEREPPRYRRPPTKHCGCE